jgi:hypothetical protein
MSDVHGSPPSDIAGWRGQDRQGGFRSMIALPTPSLTWFDCMDGGEVRIGRRGILSYLIARLARHRS